MSGGRAPLFRRLERRRDGRGAAGFDENGRARLGLRSRVASAAHGIGMSATPDRWRRVESIVHAVRERPAGERAAFLKAACTDDPSLRAEVETRLGHDAPEFLSPAGGLDGLDRPGGLAGRRLGPYVLGPLLGVGGM